MWFLDLVCGNVCLSDLFLLCEFYSLTFNNCALGIIKFLFLDMLKKGFLIVLLVWFVPLWSQEFSVCSWNISNFGKSKSEEEINAIAAVVSPFDLVLIQEVVPGPAGAKAVGKLVDVLNRKNQVWDYALSDATVSSGQRSERYVYLWKKKRFQIKRRFELDGVFKMELEREPFIGSFTFEGKEVKFFNFHAVPKKAGPEKEIAFFEQYKKVYGERIVFAGDFNLSHKHSAFDGIYKQGFKPVFYNQKTTLKQECVKGNCLASVYDNVYYPKDHLEVVRHYILPFYEVYESMKTARHLSDHVPIVVWFKWK